MSPQANDKTVDGYVATLGPEQVAVVNALRALVKRTAPEAQEVVKWAQPVYQVNGPFAYMKAFKSHVNFGFWRGAEIGDPQGILHGDGDRMRHVKVTSAADIPAEQLEGMIREAVELNRAKGDPTRRSS